MYTKLARSRTRAEPGHLFQASEQGIWFDPSDLTTMFQLPDNYQISPVTAPGQAVGLILDKSKGLLLGADLKSSFFAQLDGAAPVATFNTSTGVGTVSRVDVLNKSYLRLNLTQFRYYEISITNTGSAPLSVRTNITSNTLFVINPGSTVVSKVFINAYTQITILSNGDNTTIPLTVNYVKQVLGNHGYRTAAGTRPTYQRSGAIHYLSFDGTSNAIALPTTNFTTTDAVIVSVGALNQSVGSARMLLELSSNKTSNNGVFYIGSDPTPDRYTVGSKGSVDVFTDQAVTTPTTNVISMSAQISTDLLTFRLYSSTGVLTSASSAADQGTGNYGNFPLYIGSRGGSSLYFSGNIYGVVVFGASLNADRTRALDKYTGSKAGILTQ